MNKTEKLISVLLGLALVWCFMSGPGAKSDKDNAEQAAPQQSAAETAAAAEGSPDSAANKIAEAANELAAKAPTEAPKLKVPSVPEQIVILENEELKLELSSWGGVVKSATLKKFPRGLGEISETNPAVVLDYSRGPLGSLCAADGSNLEGLGADTAYGLLDSTATNVTFAIDGVVRKYTLGANYSLTLEETFAENVRPKAANKLCIGMMYRGDGPTDVISADSWQIDPKGGMVIHHDDDETPLRALLTGGAAGGCTAACAPAAVAPGTPEANSAVIFGAQDWIALKDRFFVTALVRSTQANSGFGATVIRDMTTEVYRPMSIGAAVQFDGGVEKRTTQFFIGPKSQSLLWDLGMKDVMEFGIWRWICYPVVWLLNAFNAMIPSYGIAIILLTILVRLIFWPLTRKSTEGMKKMQEIQPLIKELQAKFKDNPQRLQQETFALYREKKVNPMSSCLPMLIQIPVFIALFNVLRAAVELRYAGFLWIDDLSEPEHLFAAYLPFGGLNILPILMAVTMFLQSKLTPTAGDPKQQRMMTIFMPVMMLFMFYNFASALSLYWTLSQVISIVQMWMIRRNSEKKQKALEPEVIDAPKPTRQQRRHQG